MYTQCSFVVISLLIASTSSHPLYDVESTESNQKSPSIDPLLSEASYDLPMIHNNNYDMIMPAYYDNNAAESVQYQNFEKFFDSQLAASAELKMEESQFLRNTPVRAPQPLSADERRIRQRLEAVDLVRERKAMMKLKKGSTKPHPGAHQWEQFDYDLYSVNPSAYGNKSS